MVNDVASSATRDVNWFVLLVNFDAGVDKTYEHVRGKKSAGPNKHEAEVGRHGHVREVQYRRPPSSDVKGEEVVENAVHEQPHPIVPSGHEGRPPPAVVKVHELQVDQHDCCLGSREKHHHKDDGEKAEEIVHSTLPDTGENEDGLNEGSAEGDEAGDQERDGAAEVPGLRRNGARDAVDFTRSHKEVECTESNATAN